MSAFFEAVRAGDLGLVRTMVESDAGLLAARDERGLDAFTAARYSQRAEVAEYLLSAGVELTVFSAAMAGRAERIRQLLATDATLVSAHSHDGWTALHLAAFFGQLEPAQVLIEAGANVNARSLNAMRNTPMHAAAAGRKTELVRLLAERGAEVNARQEGGWTPLHAAAQSGDRDLAQLLIALGADVKLRADNQQNALDLALTGGHQGVVELLEENGAAH